MRPSRIEIIGQSEFEPREWLRREVLWASLMAPHSVQINNWLTENSVQQHNSNVSRRNLFGLDESVEYQAQSFFNQGKNIGGIIASAVLFKACMIGGGEGAKVDVIKLQTDAVDKALDNMTAGEVRENSDTEVYQTCERLARQAFVPELSEEFRVRPGTKRLMLHSSRLMSSLASFEVSLWIETSRQNGESSLPILEVQNGGHPRSAGPRVEMLQPIFNRIIASEPYQAL